MPVGKYLYSLNLLIIFEMKAYTYILTGCLMAISCDPGQVIDFCELDVVSCECTDDKYCIKVEQTDVTQFQLSLSEATGTNLLSTDQSTFNTPCATPGDWTCGAQWNIASNVATYTSGAVSDMALDFGAALTVDTYYKLTFDFTGTSNARLKIFLGSLTEFATYQGISGGTYTVYYFLDSKTTDALVFRGDNVNDFNLENILLKKMSWPDVVIKDDDGGTAYDFSHTSITQPAITYSDLAPTKMVTTLTDGAPAEVVISMIQDRATIAIVWTNIGLSAGCYSICIVDNETAAELDSRCIALQATHTCTLELSFTNSVNTFGINYEDFAGFTQALRVDARLRNPRYQYNEKIFTDGSGSHTLTYARKTKVQQLDTEPLPRDLHAALCRGFLMDDFQIDGVRFVREVSEISPSWNKNYVLAPLQMEIKEASQPNQVNRLC